ncbi:hypothetical protein LB506_004337 [Fusarium annulatum]|uniref:Mso1 N-terminal domain-containing protein n=2 Tax=Gibberella intermedia TaxID=948311 RepID=A0A1L7VDA8_FUSPR|nr:uncharacterized protein FPRO_06131 [Fusarium proliferatum ET1]KAI1067525.1 hypothetical protein LB506_004337 [Fusarium annulatum]RBA08538.1 hypothetical protein FPRO05_06818 [Fusarium proliferatum]CZR38678.1 uncharacterized protein FPRO_06131 [Fusarium proliferatum ET1]
MASWYSNLVQKTSSQISSLRQTLLSSEQDGDSEDDTHVCRVLRGYYTEKGRPFPPWLPADPKAPAQQPIQPVMTPQAGQRPGAPGQQHGGLSSLWDNGPQQPQQQAPQSLRAGGGRTPASLQPGGGGGDINRRPLPSQQRAGSYQSTGGQFGRPETASVPPGGASGGGGGGGGSAQDRLRQRLWGGGSRTTSPQAGSQGPFNPPGGNNGGGGGGGGGGGSGGYEDRFAPGGMYDQASGGGNAGLRRGGLPSGPRGYR